MTFVRTPGSDSRLSQKFATKGSEVAVSVLLNVFVEVLSCPASEKSVSSETQTREISKVRWRNVVRSESNSIALQSSISRTKHRSEVQIPSQSSIWVMKHHDLSPFRDNAPLNSQNCTDWISDLLWNAFVVWIGHQNTYFTRSEGHCMALSSFSTGNLLIGHKNGQTITYWKLFWSAIHAWFWSGMFGRVFWCSVAWALLDSMSMKPFEDWPWGEFSHRKPMFPAQNTIISGIVSANFAPSEVKSLDWRESFVSQILRSIGIAVGINSAGAGALGFTRSTGARSSPEVLRQQELRLQCTASRTRPQWTVSETRTQGRTTWICWENEVVFGRDLGARTTQTYFVCVHCVQPSLFREFGGLWTDFTKC